MRKTNIKQTQSTNSVGVFKDKLLATTIQKGIVSLLSTKGGDTTKRIGSNTKSWSGSMTQLDRALRRVVSVRTLSNWPTSPSVMRKVVNGTIYSLRRSGVTVNFSRTSDHMRKRVVEFVQR
jgi:hypothetical protein